MAKESEEIKEIRKLLDASSLSPAEKESVIKQVIKASEASGAVEEGRSAKAELERLGVISNAYRSHFDERLEGYRIEAIAQREKADIERQTMERMREMGELDDASYESRKKKWEKEENKAAKLEKRASKGAATVESRLQDITGISENYKSTAFYQMLEDPEGAGAGAMNFMKDWSSMAGSTMQKGIEATLYLASAQDGALVAFNKSTGASKKFGGQLLALESEMFQYGVTMEDATATMTALVTNVYTFDQMSKETQKDLAKTTALLENMGVGAEATSQNINFLTTAMGISGETAAEMQREMFVVAQELGRPPAEMSKAFASAQGTMAKFGKQSDAVFKKLYINAAKAGMQVEQVLSIIEKFDTFDGAAESVGKLNAILGGPFLNSMEMVTTTDPTERMKMLSDAVDQAGVSFDDMGYYQRKALTEAMGLKDVSELALVMAGDFDTMGTGAQKSQAELVELAKQSQDFTTLMDELAEMGRMLAMSMAPIVEILKGFLSFVQKLNGWIPGLSYMVFGLSTALVMLNIRLLATKTGIKMLNWEFMKGPGALIVGLSLAIGLMSSASPVLKVLGAALAVVTVGIWAFNAAFAASGVGGIIMLIAGLVLAFVGLITWLFSKDVGASTFLEGLVKISHAFLAIGLGLIFAAQGLWLLIPALLALFMMTGPLLLMLLPGGAFWSLSTGIGWIADAFERLDTTKISALTTLFAALAEVTRESAENIMLMGKGVALMSAGFALMAFNPIALAAVPLMIAGGGAGAAAGGALSGKGIPGTGVGAKPKKLLPLTINVELNGEKLGKFVKDVVVKELNYNQG